MSSSWGSKAPRGGSSPVPGVVPGNDQTVFLAGLFPGVGLLIVLSYEKSTHEVLGGLDEQFHSIFADL